MVEKIKVKTLGEPVEEVEEEPVKKVKTVQLVEVPTGYTLAYQLPDGTNVDQPTFNVWLANKILNIERQLFNA